MEKKYAMGYCDIGRSQCYGISLDDDNYAKISPGLKPLSTTLSTPFKYALGEEYEWAYVNANCNANGILDDDYTLQAYGNITIPNGSGLAVYGTINMAISKEISVYGELELNNSSTLQKISGSPLCLY